MSHCGSEIGCDLCFMLTFKAELFSQYECGFEMKITFSVFF